MTPSLSGSSVMPAGNRDPKHLVILIHGYGSNADDLIGLVPHWAGDLPDTVFVAPNGPARCAGTLGGYQWWPVNTFTMAERVTGAQQAAPILDNFIDQQLRRFGLHESQLALVGFSQGTMMALHVGPRRDRQIAGIVGYSGMVADPVGLNSASRSKPPVLLVHGDADTVLPIAAFHQAKAALTAAGFDLTTHVSPGLGHSVDEVGLGLGKQFLRKVFQ